MNARPQVARQTGAQRTVRADHGRGVVGVSMAAGHLPVDLAHLHVLEGLADPVVAADQTNRILYVNLAAETLLGWCRTDLIGQELTVLMPDRLRDAHLAGFQRYVSTRQPRILGQPIRVPALHRDGTELDVELRLSVLTNDSNDLLLVASLRDLRDRVELERQLTVTRYLRATTEAAATLTSLLDLQQVLDTVVHTLVNHFDAALARVWLSEGDTGALSLLAQEGEAPAPAASSPTRLHREELPMWLEWPATRRQPYIDSDLRDHPEFDPEWVRNQGVVAVAAFPLARGIELHGVLVIFARQPLHDEVIEALSTFATIVTTSLHDITLLEREQAARAQAENAIQIRDEFLSSVSHDLRSPLAALKGRAQILRRRAMQLSPDLASTFVPGLESIDASTTKMAKLINDLVDVARLRADQPLQLEREPIDLVALVRQIVSDQENETGYASIQMETDVADLIGWWDAARLERVLVNLLSNAIKYSPDGGDITVSLQVEGDPPANAILHVQDHGLGIPAADLPSIFARFYRGSNVVGVLPGSGVGLAGAQQIVEQHGGSMTVESQEGHGTTFTVCLPIEQPEQ